MTATGERLRNLTGDHFDTLRVGPRMASVASARSRESEEACRKVYTIHRDGSGLRRLTNGCQTSVAWSPDDDDPTHAAKFGTVPLPSL
jgi:hypothetical protein